MLQFETRLAASDIPLSNRAVSRPRYKATAVGRERDTRDGVTVRLHWTDQPYHWHVNDGTEVLVVLDGVLDMYYRNQTGEHVKRMQAGDIFQADAGDAHVGHPIGVARVLVIERAGSE